MLDTRFDGVPVWSEGELIAIELVALIVLEEPVALIVFEEPVKLPILVELDTLACPESVCIFPEVCGFGLMEAELLRD